MPLIVRYETPIEKAYNALTPELFALGREWKGNDADISFPTRDLVHHVCHALLIEHEFEQVVVFHASLAAGGSPGSRVRTGRS